MAPSVLVVATLLSADPGGSEIHFGGALGLGMAVPFQNNNGGAGFQLGVKGFLDYSISKQFAVGVVLPLAFAFFSTSQTSFGIVATSSLTEIDFMPGGRAVMTLADFVRVGLELGFGPTYQDYKTRAVLGSFEQVGGANRTVFSIRSAVIVEVEPPSLSGLMFYCEPLAIHGRFGDQQISEYRFTIGAGYRR